jgi:hypothetical protein
MRTHRFAAVVALALSCAFLTVSCVRSLEAGEPGEAPGSVGTESSTMASEPTEPSSMGDEHTGEAQDPWTRADCQNAFVQNIRWCDTWTVTTRPACYGIMAGLHVACVKGAEVLNAADS